MKEETKQNILNSLVSGKSLTTVLSAKAKEFMFESVQNELVTKYETDGWEVYKRYKTSIRMQRRKPMDMAFEDDVWALFARMGFSFLNKDRNFRLPYSNDEKLTQQIDIFVADEETILIIECKVAGNPKQSNFKETIEAIGGKKEGLITTIQQLFPDAKYKIKFIFATKNYYLSEQDNARLNNYGIIHFDEETLKYYQELTKHLGTSAKYQLLGSIFEGQTIPELDNRIPAIKGKMGGYTYYSFSIEPEKLLKIGYVLHRNKANRKLMPTYQRLIKKSRLKSVQDFVDNGGFFPNSIIINIDTNGKSVRFDSAGNQVEKSISRIGILHLPKKYRSAYIIDGQHRLYGYANSPYKATNCIPVVAFINLERTQQVKLFMQINENQKAVPKNLRNTLNSDLLWNSENRTEQIKALKLQIALSLGEEMQSPLYDRIIIGENIKSATRCITIDTIKVGLDRGNFFGTFDKDSIKTDGTFYKGNNDATLERLFPFIVGCFDYIKNNLPEEWSKGDADDGFLTINANVESLLRLFSDIVDHIVKAKGVNPKVDSTQNVMQEMEFYLDPIIDFYKNLTSESKIELKKSYGIAGRTKVWRILQREISKVRTDFHPDGLDKYWKDEDKRYNEDSFRFIRDIETFMKEDFKTKLEQAYGSQWFKRGVPKAVYDKANQLASEKNYEITDASEEYSPWDCLTLIDYRRIATYGSNWRDIFEKYYTKPGEEKGGNKEAKTEWMQKLERIRNNNFHTYSVKEEEFEFLSELHKWLIETSD